MKGRKNLTSEKFYVPIIFLEKNCVFLIEKKNCRSKCFKKITQTKSKN